MSYAPLSCKSNFSFLEGASHPSELIEKAHRLGLEHLALVDRDGVYGLVRAHVSARELDLHLICGSQVTVRDQGNESSIVLLAQDRAGYANLCRLVTIGRRRCEKGKSRVSWREVGEHAAGLIALYREGPLEDLKDAFGDRLYVALLRHKRATDAACEARLREQAKRCGVLTVAANEVLYHTAARRALQDVLTCVRCGVTLQTAGKKTNPNAEHALLGPYAFTRLFSDDPDSVARSLEIADRCRFSLADLRYRYPSERLPDGQTSAQWLRQLTQEGARTRYPQGIPTRVQQSIEKELALIDELDYCGYFLTMWEIVRYCREQNILCQGRGSAANSAVCYCLGVTAVDPARIDVLFERFLSKERAEPPDIDLDIMHERREEVIQHVYEKYGRKHAAMVANFIRYRTKSAIRDVGKALSIPQTSLDRLAKLHSHYDEFDENRIRQAGLDPESKTYELFVRLVEEIQNFPRHLSIHPGGFLLGHEPVHDIVPIENASMEDRTVIQWDKDDVEDLGLFKVDLLGLGALTQLDLAFKLLEDKVSLATIPEGDEKTYDMICKGDTVGVFQIESRAQMAMLPRLRPRRFYDLVVEISIVRPGPITGGMVHPYLRRRKGEEKIVYPHPCLEPVLKKTLGVPLFQEQVMRLAVVAADYTPGEADQLRRDMAAWRKTGRIERHRKRLTERMEKKGIAPEFAEAVFNQIRGFGEYGFPESHAASFALIAYATAWLKCHHPAEFACSLLNAQPMGFYSPATIIDDAKRSGINMLPIDVQHSSWDCTMEQTCVRIGMRFLKGFRKPDAERVAQKAPYKSVGDFTLKTGLNKSARNMLAKAGALQSLQNDRRKALWETARPEPDLLPLQEREETPDFKNLTEFEKVYWDYHAADHSTKDHPLGPMRKALLAQGLPDAKAVNAMPHNRRVRYAGMVICRQRPGTAGGVTFMTLEDESGFVNLIVWQRVFQQYAVIAKTAAFLGVTGKVQREDGVTHLIADHLWRPGIDDHDEPAQARSRDFH